MIFLFFLFYLPVHFPAPLVQKMYILFLCKVCVFKGKTQKCYSNVVKHLSYVFLANSDIFAKLRCSFTSYIPMNHDILLFIAGSNNSDNHEMVQLFKSFILCWKKIDI